MQPMPGQPVVQQPVAQQPIQVQAVPAEGHMPVNAYTAKEEKEWGISTPTPAEYMTGFLVLLGLIFWMISYWMVGGGEAWIVMLFQGLAYTFWFGAIVTAVHSVEKALLNSKK